MTAATMKNAFQAAEDFSTEAPRPLRRPLPPADPFPVDALGDVLGAAANAIHDAVQAPVPMCCQSVMAAASHVAQAFADVELPSKQLRPISGYFLTIGASGERKSSCDQQALWPTRTRQKQLAADHAATAFAANNAREAWAKAKDNILAERKLSLPERQEALGDLGPEPRRPLSPILLLTEPTFEGLVRLMRDGQPSLGLFSSEGGQFIGGHGMRDESKMRTATALSTLWDGEPITRVRASEDATVLSGRRFSLHLMCQPEVAQVLLGDRMLLDQGLLSRMLVTAPESTAGTRLWREPKPESDAAIRRYGARLLSLLERPMPVTADRPNELHPRPLMMSERAKLLWIAFHDDVEREIRRGGFLEPVKGLANKLPEHAARLAAVVTLIEAADATGITAEAMSAGVKLAKHYAAEARRLFDAGWVKPEILLAEQLLAWLQHHWREPFIGLSDVYQLGPNPLRDKASAKPIVGILEDHGWLRRIPEGAVVKGERKREAWAIVRAA